MTNLVFVVHDSSDIDLAKKFTRACLKVGLFKELKRHAFYLKPGEARRRKAERARKAVRKRGRQYRVRLDGNGDPI